MDGQSQPCLHAQWQSGAVWYIPLKDFLSHEEVKVSASPCFAPCRVTVLLHVTLMPETSHFAVCLYMASASTGMLLLQMQQKVASDTDGDRCSAMLTCHTAECCVLTLLQSQQKCAQRSRHIACICQLTWSPNAGGPDFNSNIDMPGLLPQVCTVVAGCVCVQN